MSLAEIAFQELQRLPQPMVLEIIDFIGYLEKKNGIDDAQLISAQSKSLSNLWDNSEDEIWNAYKPV